MLFPLIRHGTSRCLTRTAVHQGFSTTAYQRANGQSAHRKNGFTGRPPVFQKSVEENGEKLELTPGLTPVKRPRVNGKRASERLERLSENVEAWLQATPAGVSDSSQDYRDIQGRRLTKLKTSESLSDDSAIADTAFLDGLAKDIRGRKLARLETSESLSNDSAGADTAFLDTLAKDIPAGVSESSQHYRAIRIRKLAKPKTSESLSDDSTSADTAFLDGLAKEDATRREMQVNTDGQGSLQGAPAKFFRRVESAEPKSSVSPDGSTITDTSFLDRPLADDLVIKKVGQRMGYEERSYQKLPEGSMSGDTRFLNELSIEDVSGRTASHEDASGVSSTMEMMTQLRETMAAQNPQALLKFVWKASKNLEFMHTIPGVTFIEILRQLNPQNDFSPLRPEYKGQGPKHLRMLSGWREQFYSVLRDRRSFYRDIAQRRIESGRTLGVREYAELLNMARVTWDGPTALEIMKDILANNVEPDLTCYNHYFEARCWSDTYVPHERQRLRVTPYNMEMRTNGPIRKATQRILIQGHRVEEGGLRAEIRRMFSKMIDNGINADTKAYVNLITAHSREGDLSAVSSVLWRVWRVDVDGLLAGQLEGSSILPRKDSPIYPNQDLLFILAHAFGANNQLPEAIRIVDYFSQTYDIPIPQLVWGELLDWAYTLSLKRRKNRKVDGAQLGQLPLQSVGSLWNVMRGEPYCMEPNLFMYDIVIRHYYRRSMLTSFVEHMREGVRFHEQLFDKYAKEKQILQDRIRRGDIYTVEELDSETIRLEELRQERWVSFVIVRKWFELLLGQRNWLNDKVRSTIWERQMLPDAVQEFGRYKARRPIEYSISTGHVQLVYAKGPRKMPEDVDLGDILEVPELPAGDDIDEMGEVDEMDEKDGGIDTEDMDETEQEEQEPDIVGVRRLRG